MLTLVLAGGVAYQQRYSSGIWGDLEEAEARLGTTEGFEKLDSRREGTTVCLVSCNEARIIVALQTDLAPDAACAAMLAAVSALSDDAAEGNDTRGCAVSGRLDGMGDANVTALIRPADEIASIADYEPGWVRDEAERVAGSLFVEMYLNSGID